MGKMRQPALIFSLFLITLIAWSVPGPARDFTWGDFTFGPNRETHRLDREKAVARENYCPTGGCIIRLDKVSVKPARARAGETLLLITSYTLLTPEKVAIPISITREILFQGKSLGKTKSLESRRLNGTWDQEVNFALPANAAAGDYTLTTTINTGYGQDQKSAQFRVE
jgi:hypothetical protein